MAALAIGSTGAQVKTIQNALQQLGYYPAKLDGIYGPITQAGIALFQTDNRLSVTGIADDRTQSRLLISRRQSGVKKWALTDADIQEVADQLHVEKAVVYAVSEVESVGSGFYLEGIPKVLFERHQMYRLIKENVSQAAADKAMSERPDLVNTARGGYSGGLREWTRFTAAGKYDRELSIQACSWGRYQIMGFHYKLLGYSTPSKYMTAMCDHEREHISAFAAFIEADPQLITSLQNRDWPTFASIYNGPAYAENQYDIKLAAAYAKYSNL